MVKCAECDMMIGTAEDSMQLHKMEFHTLRVCDQCQVSIEAYKLPEHKVSKVYPINAAQVYAGPHFDFEAQCGRADRVQIFAK